jgi:hypothetical protein
MNRILISLALTCALGLYCGNANAGSFVAGTGTQAGTVTDNTTNLMWQQCSDGQSGASCTGTAVTVTWNNAITYCESLSLGGFSDWRLPNIKELLSIVDMTLATAAAINATYFPNTPSSNYWSSTSYAPDTTSAWLVVFYDGTTLSSNKTNPLYVRCVRGQ